MLYQVIVATLLVSISVALHAMGMVMLFGHLVRLSPRLEQYVGTAGVLLLLIQVFVFILALHLLQIGMWAGFYVRWGALQNFETALYFSIVSYATVGYGTSCCRCSGAWWAPSKGLPAFCCSVGRLVSFSSW